MEPKFTLFEYMYRDAGNFKTTGRLLLSGQDPQAEGAIRRCLDWGDQFVAEQIGVPPPVRRALGSRRRRTLGARSRLSRVSGAAKR